MLSSAVLCVYIFDITVLPAPIITFYPRPVDELQWETDIDNDLLQRIMS